MPTPGRCAFRTGRHLRRLGRPPDLERLADGLRHYLTSIKHQTIQEELDRNPDYFFEMAPYALAMGAEDGFAKRFGRRIMPQCGYLEAGRSEKRTAREWAYLMRQTAEKLDNGAKRNNR